MDEVVDSTARMYGKWKLFCLTASLQIKTSKFKNTCERKPHGTGHQHPTYKYLLAFSEGHSSWKSTWCSSNSTPAIKKTRRINSPRPLALKYVSLYDFLDIFTTLDKRPAPRSIEHSISRERLGKTCHMFFLEVGGRGSKVLACAWRHWKLYFTSFHSFNKSLIKVGTCIGFLRLLQ